jgi:hypothetical protein
LQTSKEHIARFIRNCLPPEKRETSWGYLASEFPWYNIIHWLRANDHPEDEALLQKAGLYAPDILRLHVWLHTQNEQAEHAALENQKHFNSAEVSQIGPPDDNASSNLSEIANEFATNTISNNDLGPASKNAVMGNLEGTEATGIKELESENAGLKLPGLTTLQLPGQDALSEITIEPYHAVDYFASQGIKVDKTLPGKEETQLDKQVKSFTDWLKTMKKLKYQPATQYVDPLVETQAKKSLDKKEIVTEAMAEVWAKQGKFEEASQVYARLMLLHPEKTPYFAARLQELNTKQ